MLSSCLGAARAQAQQVAENMKSGGMDFSKMAEMMGGMGGGGGGGGELACALIRPLWQCRLGLSIGAYGSPVP